MFLPKAIGSQIEDPVLSGEEWDTSSPVWSSLGVPETFKTVQAIATALGTHQIWPNQLTYSTLRPDEPLALLHGFWV